MAVLRRRVNHGTERSKAGQGRPLPSTRSWLRSLCMKKRATNPDQERHTHSGREELKPHKVTLNPPSVPRTPSPSCAARPSAQGAISYSKVAALDDHNDLCSSPLVSMPHSTPSTSEDEADAFYTCPTTPTEHNTDDLSCLPGTPTKPARLAQSIQRFHPVTLMKRRQVNRHLKKQFRQKSSQVPKEGFLCDPIPLKFHRLDTATVEKTDFEMYLEQALSKSSTSSLRASPSAQLE